MFKGLNLGRGQQNEEQIEFDEHGNLTGKDFDLGGEDDQRLHGERILFYCSYVLETMDPYFIQKVVAERHLAMDVIRHGEKQFSFTRQTLKPYTQIWHLSDQHAHLSRRDVEIIKEFNEAGNGVFILADNAPYFADANQLLQELCGTQVSGDKTADRILTPGSQLAPGNFIKHPLTTGLNNLYEGITICTVHPARDVTMLGISHDGQNCMAAFERKGQRVVIDTGFTKLYEDRFYKTPGTARYLRNAAFWLAHATRDSKYELLTTPEKIATISPGQTTSPYGYSLKERNTLLFVLSWRGQAELGLEVKRPNGSVYTNQFGAQGPIQLEIPMADVGVWTCTVNGAKIPQANFPYVLTAIERRNAVKLGPRPISYSCFIVIDSSQAATKQAVQTITEGVAALVRRLQKASIPSITLDLSISGASSNSTAIAPVRPIQEWREASLAGTGSPEFNASLQNLASAVKERYRATGRKSLIFLVLANTPRDNLDSAIKALAQLRDQNKANTIAIGLSREVDHALLKHLGAIALSLQRPDAVGAAFEWMAQMTEIIMRSLQTSGEGTKMTPPALPIDVLWLR